MRFLLSVLVLVMLAGILGVVGQHVIDHRRDASNRSLTRAEVARFQRQVHLQAALLASKGSDKSFPPSIDPKWFEGQRPTNPLLDTDRPWVEIASENQRNLLHPPDLAAAEPGTAMFWYNPWNGVVRARVPQGISDAQVLELYNEVNDSTLDSIFEPIDTTGLR